MSHGTADVTEDAFLGGRLLLEQPRSGYRAGGDSVFLAAAVPAVGGDQVLDVGAGTGAVALCLARRIDGVAIDGLEVQPALADLARTNVARNGLEHRVRIVTGTVASAQPELARNTYHHVVTNPPYLEQGTATAPPDRSKARAFLTEDMTLGQWIAAALKFIRPLGWLHVIQRTDRLADIMAGLHTRAGDITICPLWPAHGEEARRVIIRARKGGRGPTRVCPGLVLHESDGQYTARADAILRDGAPLLF